MVWSHGLARGFSIQRILLTITVLAGMVVSSAASAQNGDDSWSQCDNDPNPDVKISACTAVIQSGQPEHYGPALERRGDAYAKKGETDNAIDDYSQLLALEPNFAPALDNRGNEFTKEGQYDRAMQDYNQAIQLQPDQFKAYNNRCLVRAIIGDLQPALADCDQALKLALKLAPDEVSHIYDSRGFVNLKMKNAAAAIADYDEAIKSDPTLGSSFYGRGLAKQMRGDRLDGDADLAVAKKLTPTIAEQFAKWGVK